MQSLVRASGALARRAVPRRGLADAAAAADKLSFNFFLPNNALMKGANVVRHRDRPSNHCTLNLRQL